MLSGLLKWGGGVLSAFAGPESLEKWTLLVPMMGAAQVWVSVSLYIALGSWISSGKSQGWG